jgi:hypothetical protein
MGCSANKKNAFIFASSPELFKITGLKICSLLDFAKKFPQTFQVIFKELMKILI